MTPADTEQDLFFLAGCERGRFASGGVLANAALATAMGGTAVHATDSDMFTATVRCHDANGEVYTVTIGRETVSVSSYSDDAILAAVEARADAVPAIA